MGGAYNRKGNGKIVGLAIPSFEDKGDREDSRKVWRGYTNQRFWIFPMDSDPTEAVMTQSRK